MLKKKNETLFMLWVITLMFTSFALMSYSPFYLCIAKYGLFCMNMFDAIYPILQSLPLFICKALGAK